MEISSDENDAVNCLYNDMPSFKTNSLSKQFNVVFVYRFLLHFLLAEQIAC